MANAGKNKNRINNAHLSGPDRTAKCACHGEILVIPQEHSKLKYYLPLSSRVHQKVCVCVFFFLDLISCTHEHITLLIYILFDFILFLASRGYGQHARDEREKCF